jgi:UDP-N-acetylglucosamine--N-acetylmuramyl-(pentapeptide) pyrophosphoryl-undecaprenol N-acetylglucosamine transferase
MHAEIEKAFGETGLPGSVCAFIDDMPGAFAEADLIVCRSGAGAVAEIAAAGKPSVMVPFPFAADDHQLKNAEAFKRAGAAILVRDAEWTGERLFQTVSSLFHDRERLAAMSENALGLAHYGAASKAAKILIDIASSGRNNKL